ncbi:DNA mismatch repair protein [Burkholderia pseudomallei]|nr:DNA mismatch repair protein [Burkholderia pseudomallei]
MGRKAIDNGLDTCESRPNRHIGRPASFARRPDKVNSHPIPYTQTDIRTMATQIDASSEAAAATAAAQHTPMMQRSLCHI